LMMSSKLQLSQMIARAEDLINLGLRRKEAIEAICYYLLAFLNSVVVKFLLKSTADFWQGSYYQVQDTFLSRLPIRRINEINLKAFQDIVHLSKLVVGGQTSKVLEIENIILRIYELESEKTKLGSTIL
jgi:hypothetical protein